MKKFAGFLLLGILILGCGCSTTEEESAKPKKEKKTQTQVQRQRRQEAEPPSLMGSGLTAREQELYLEKGDSSNISVGTDVDFKERSQRSSEWVFGSWVPTEKRQRKVIPFSD